MCTIKLILFQMTEISTLRKLELRKTNVDKSLDRILKYYNMSVRLLKCESCCPGRNVRCA